MIPMTKIDGAPDVSTAVAGMAFFSGTGPAGKTCGDCKHCGYSRESRVGKWSDQLQQLVYKSYRVTKCAVFNRLTHKHGADIKAEYPACKYFDPRREKVSA